MSRLLDPVPLLLGGLAGALAGGIASYAVDGFVSWPLVVAFLVGTLVTSLAVLVALGPSRGFGAQRVYGMHRPGGEWRYAGGRVGVGPFTPPMPSPPPAPGTEPSASGDEKIAAGGGMSPGRPRGGPFDRFDSSAKRVLALAQDEAIRFNHNYIGTEHLLLGILREAGVAARALEALGVEISKCRTALEFIVGRGDSQTQPTDITLSPRTKKIIELSIDEARTLGHPTVASAHLLLGLIREGEGIASGMIESLGVKLEDVRQKTLELMAPEP